MEMVGNTAITGKGSARCVANSLMLCQSSKMCSVAVIGHSLVPTTVTLNDLTNETIDVYRFPGATIDSLTHHLNQCNFWNKTYDLIILCIGGNILTKDDVSNVFDKFCNLVRRLATDS